MSGLVFTLREAPPERLDLSPLTPDRLAGLAVSEIERLPVGTTKRRLLVGDVFAVSGGDAADIRFAGGSERFDRLGEGMSGGVVRLQGDAGFRAGRRMTGGRIEISGSAGALTGSGMSGGAIGVAGDAGDDLGAPSFGETAGMKGGEIRVAGSAGARAGDRMRRGTIVVEGDCGPHAGCRMIAGTLLVKGRAASGAGTLMKRGTLVLAGGAAPLGPTFQDNGPQDLILLRLMARAFPGLLDGRAMRRFAGDTAVSSLGEVFVPA